jgi:hypothetical protein
LPAGHLFLHVVLKLNRQRHSDSYEDKVGRRQGPRFRPDGASILVSRATRRNGSDTLGKHYDEPLNGEQMRYAVSRVRRR